MESYYSAATDLSQVLQRAFALALDQPADFFQDLFQRQSSLLKINHYPPQDSPQTVSNIGVVPHSDEIGFTILWQDDSGGLEIESKSGERARRSEEIILEIPKNNKLSKPNLDDD